MAPDTVIGRTAELDVVARFFDRTPEGACGLLLEGDAGIGKTTLWLEAVERARQAGRVLTSRASEAEARLSFTVLGDLLVTALDDQVLTELPPAQRRALEAALALDPSTSTRPDQRTVSLAVLAVLRALAASGPLTIAVDDIQWVDAPSARALSFALHRLETDPMRVVAARRRGAGSAEPLDLAQLLPGGVERIELAALDRATLGRILRLRLGHAPPPLVARIHEQTGGNPFFAIEVARALGAESVLSAGEPLPVPSDLEELLRRRLAALSPKARDACLLISSAPVATDHVVGAAGATVEAIAEARGAGVVATRGSRLEFTHPLLGSTVYANASARERESAHERLSAAATDAEMRARHLALSSTVPREEVAAVLEDAATRARERGAPLAAAELLELAASLTPPESDRRSWRQGSAAVALFDAGDGESARRLLGDLIAGLEPGVQRASLLFRLSFISWYDVPRVRSLLAQALAESGDNDDLKARILADTAWVEYESCRPGEARRVALGALALARGPSDSFPTRHALSALATADAVLGRPARQAIEQAIALEVEATPGESSTPTICHGRLLLWAGELARARTTLETVLARFVEQGRDAGTWEIRALLAEVALRAGEWEQGAAHAADALEIARDAGRSNEIAAVLVTKAAIEAATGQIDLARANGLEAFSQCIRNDDSWGELGARAALGFLELTRGDAIAAHEWLAPAVMVCNESGLREPGVFLFVPDEVEALIVLGEIDEAERLAELLAEQGEALDRPLARATAARCHGLVAGARGELQTAAEHLERALVEHSHAEQPFELARTLLVSGEVQRRMKRKRSARELLERARDTFGSLGAPMWTARAESELARVGGRAPSPDTLTATETEVARLVAEGMSNREVADRLFISPHTVDANLRRVYRKLQIHSRVELARKM